MAATAAKLDGAGADATQIADRALAVGAGQGFALAARVTAVAVLVAADTIRHAPPNSREWHRVNPREVKVPA